MTRHKTISKLSIAAFALLAAAVPSFAQAQLDQSSRDMQVSVETQAIEQTIASNAELIAAAKGGVTTPSTSEVDRSSVKNVTRPASPKLSAGAFKLQNNFTSVSSQFVSPKLTFNYDSPSAPSARKQYRSDDYDSTSTGRKLVTFVPSRGQKLPDQQSW